MLLNLSDLYNFPILRKAQKSSQPENIHKVIHRMIVRAILTIAKSFPANTVKNSCFAPVCGIL